MEMRNSKYMSGRLQTIVLFIVTVFAVSCSDKKNYDIPKGEEEHEHHEETSSVEIDAAQFKQLNIQLGDVEMKNLSTALKATGFLKVPPTNKANITAIIGGTVNSILVMEGEHVQKGQTVATIANQEFIRMQREYLEAQSQIIFAEADYNRQKELSEKNVASQKSFQQVTSNYQTLKASLNALKQQLTLLNINTASLTAENISLYINIKSPIAGNIANIEINIGSTVEPSKDLMDVVDNSQLHLDLFVFEQDLPKVRIGQTVDVLLTNLPGKHYDAKIFSIGSAFQGESKSIPVHASLTSEKSGLIEGMSVIANINVGNNSVLSVSSSAIASFGGNDYIFIQSENENHKHSDEEKNHQHQEGEKPDEHKEHNHSESEQHNDSNGHPENKFSFKRIQIKKGVSDSGFTEIVPLEELPHDAKVVVNGSFYLMAMLTNEGEHEH